MKNFFRAMLLIIFVFCLFSCSSGAKEVSQANNSDESQAATDALKAYFTSLHNGDYVAAAALYGGSFETMINNNPDINSGDHAKLLERACTINGNMCLDTVSIVMDTITADGNYLFTVKFVNEDGTPFVLGPCCGANETDSPPVEEFQFTVQPGVNGDYRVLELPPYVP